MSRDIPKVSFLKFHPFFWSHLIQGNFRRILRDIRVRCQIR
jgi:hypothetical protein